MANIKNTKTEQNILAAFAGEAQARARYLFAEEQARAEGNTEIAELFARMAQNETAHARLWFKLSHDGLGTSEQNLRESANGESYEWSSMYPAFAKTAREEGLENIAQMFEKVAAIEKNHEQTFLQAFAKLKGETQAVPEKQAVHRNRCIFCGALFENRPDACPVCGAIGSYEDAVVYE